jgi:eukaryotic-like serine/threonine-protein kinase
MLRSGDIVAEKYRIERELGAGGMGAVYVAINEVLQKPVAIKVMGAGFATQPEAVARFFREAMSASRVRHPAIVEIYDAGDHRGSPWMAMQLLEGESLARHIQRGPIALGELMPIFGPVLSALDAVHTHGIVHRDLKPDNIFLERRMDGTVQPKLLDFGIAKTQDGLQKLTESGAIMGTAHYLAPEQARDATTVDPRTDLYAIGVVLYESLTGRMPHEASTLPELISKLISEDPAPMHHIAPRIPEALANVVQWCLARDPGARPQRASDLAYHLEQSLVGVPAVQPSVPSTPLSAPSHHTSPLGPMYATPPSTLPMTAGFSPAPAPYPHPPSSSSSGVVKIVIALLALFVLLRADRRMVGSERRPSGRVPDRPSTGRRVPLRERGAQPALHRHVHRDRAPIEARVRRARLGGHGDDRTRRRDDAHEGYDPLLVGGALRPVRPARRGHEHRSHAR